jgi:hypothetical protein
VNDAKVDIIVQYWRTAGHDMMLARLATHHTTPEGLNVRARMGTLTAARVQRHRRDAGHADMQCGMQHKMLLQAASKCKSSAAGSSRQEAAGSGLAVRWQA